MFFAGQGVALADTGSQALDIRLGDNSARFMYATEVFGGSFGPASMEFGVFFNEDNDSLFHAGFFIESESLDNPFSIAIGTRAYYGDAGNAPGETQTDVGAIAIGGEFTFTPKNFAGFGFAANYYVAPSVLSFMDADRFVEYGARIEFSITDAAKLLLGYRNIEADREDGSTVEIDSGLIFGIGLRF
jgi:hypothetical protein